MGIKSSRYLCSVTTHLEVSSVSRLSNERIALQEFNMYSVTYIIANKLHVVTHPTLLVINDLYFALREFGVSQVRMWDQNKQLIH